MKKSLMFFVVLALTLLFWGALTPIFSQTCPGPIPNCEEKAFDHGIPIPPGTADIEGVWDLLS